MAHHIGPFVQWLKQRKPVNLSRFHARASVETVAGRVNVSRSSSPCSPLPRDLCSVWAVFFRGARIRWDMSQVNSQLNIARQGSLE